MKRCIEIKIREYQSMKGFIEIKIEETQSPKGFFEIKIEGNIIFAHARYCSKMIFA